MPLDAPHFATDRLINELGNAYLRLKRDGRASVICEPDNAIASQFLREVGASGVPAGMSRKTGSPNEGFHVYTGRDRPTASRQTIELLEPESDRWPMDRPMTLGSGPVSAGSPLAAKLIEQLPAPTLVKVPVTQTGFPAVKMYAALSCADEAKNHTQTTDPVEFTPTGSGVFLEVSLLSEVPVGTRYQGIWLGFSPDALRLQKLVPAKKKTETLRRFDRTGRKAPTKNETRIGTPKPLTFGKLSGKGDIERRGGQGHDLYPMTLRVVVVECDNSPAGGDSLPSPPSETKVIPPKRTRVRKTVIDPATEAETTTVVQTEGPHPNEALLIRPDDMAKRAVGYKIYCQINEGTNVPWYRLVATSKPDRSVHFAKNATVRLYGITDEMQVKGQLGYVLVQEDPPTEDTTGLEDISGEMEPPVSVGAARPAPGRYVVAYSETRGGRETPVSRFAEVTLAGASGVATETFEVRFPPKVNRIPNALFSRIGSDNRPLSWTFSLAGGTIFPYAGGTGIKTAGQILDALQTPEAKQSAPMPVDTDKLETFRGTLKVSDRVSGSGRVEVVQYSDAAGTVALSAITLATLSANGTSPYIKKVGPGGDVPWHSDTASCRVRWYAFGNPRNLRVDLIKPALHPFDGAPRTFEERPENSRELWVPTNDPSVPYPSGHQVVISYPPAVSGLQAGVAPPLDFATHDGSLEPGFSTSKSTANTDTTASLATRSGITVFRSAKTRKGTFASAIASKTYTAAGTLAIRSLIWLDNTPTFVGARVAVLTILSGDVLALLYVRRDPSNLSTLLLSTFGVSGFQRFAPVASYLPLGAMIDAELIVGGAGTTGGNASVNLGIEDDEPSPRASISGVDWSGKPASSVSYGGRAESHSATTWSFDFDDTVVTRSGYASGSALTPNFEPLEEPDVPLKPGTILAAV